MVYGNKCTKLTGLSNHIILMYKFNLSFCFFKMAISFFNGFSSSGEGKDFASKATESWNSVVGMNEINQKWQGKYQN